MNKVLLVCIASIFITGCASLFNRGPDIDRVKIETVFSTIPDDYMTCPLPPVVPAEILSMILQSETGEDDYNRIMVTEYFNNNETCARNMARIRRLNQRWQDHNDLLSSEGDN